MQASLYGIFQRMAEPGESFKHKMVSNASARAQEVHRFRGFEQRRQKLKYDRAFRCLKDQYINLRKQLIFGSDQEIMDGWRARMPELDFEPYQLRAFDFRARNAPKSTARRLREALLEAADGWYPGFLRSKEINDILGYKQDSGDFFVPMDPQYDKRMADMFSIFEKKVLREVQKKLKSRHF